jgi:hypothetical protein
MLNYETAKMLLQKTMDSAFSKNIGTKTKRIALANVLLRRIPLSSADNVSLMVWAADYAGNWKGN